MVQCKKPVAATSPANTFIPIPRNEDATLEDHEVASITNSTRLYTPELSSRSGSGSGLGSRSGFQSEHSSFNIYLRDSRLNPGNLYIPDGSGDTITSRSGNCYSYLENGHDTSLVRIETFIYYFETDLFIIDHHNGDVYLYDKDLRSLELLAIQASTTPLLAEAVKMLAQTATNTPL